MHWFCALKSPGSTNKIPSNVECRPYLFVCLVSSAHIFQFSCLCRTNESMITIIFLTSYSLSHVSLFVRCCCCCCCLILFLYFCFVLFCFVFLPLFLSTCRNFSLHLISIKCTAHCTLQITRVNDLVATGPDSFYATNDGCIRWPKSRDREFLVEMLLLWNCGSIVYYDGISARVVGDGYLLANGLELSSDGRCVKSLYPDIVALDYRFRFAISQQIHLATCYSKTFDLGEFL